MFVSGHVFRIMSLFTINYMTRKEIAIIINDKDRTFFMPSQPGWLHQDYKQQENVYIRYDDGMRVHVNLD